ncbi:MAG TPA: squalene synthase HpnC, partial [Dehalococcoidia bacterium]|nr:squalene synthase HpnC [Dehalococcoidia bacterium]
MGPRALPTSVRGKSHSPGQYGPSRMTTRNDLRRWPVERPTTLQEAYAWCERYARRHDENFTVVSSLLPKKLRRHFFAVYSFSRYTDDLGDEAEGDKLALLDAWEQDLLEATTGNPHRPLLIALSKTIEQCEIPLDPFLRLIEANRIDQRISRFTTYSDLIKYCTYSATPVGQMVLAVLGYRDEERIALSDQTCIGLQLANFWQDVSVDVDKGRIYIPQEDLERFGCDDQQIIDRRFNDRYRELMQFQVTRARALFSEGKKLEARVSRSVRTDIRLFRLGGEAILNAIEAGGYDT